MAWTKHTAPEAAAKVFSQTKPGLAMGFHGMIAPGTPQPILDGIRSAKDDQLSGNEVELLNSVVQAWLGGMELPEADIHQAVTVMQRLDFININDVSVVTSNFIQWGLDRGGSHKASR